MQVCAAAAVDTGLPTARTCSNALHDVVIVSAVRTPMCKASGRHGTREAVTGRGWLSGTGWGVRIGGGGARREASGKGACWPSTCTQVAARQIATLCPTITALTFLYVQAMVGGFKDTPIDDLVVAVLKETLKRTGVKPEASTG